MTKFSNRNQLIGTLLLIIAIVCFGYVLTPDSFASDEHGSETNKLADSTSKQLHDLEKGESHEGHDHGLEHSDSAEKHDEELEQEESHEGHDHELEQSKAAEGHDEELEQEESHEGHDHDLEQDESAEGHAEDDGHAGHDDELIVELSPEAMEMAKITLAKVCRGCVGRSIDLPGQVGFDEDRLIHVTPRFAGIAKEVRYRVGDYVHEGDVVAVIESNESMTPYEIKASISGWIIKRDVVSGEFVSEENSIYHIADLSHVWVNLAVYPKDAEHIRRGQKATITAIGSGIQTEGTIEYVTPVFDLDTRSITARIVVPNSNNNWRPGTFVQAQVLTDPGDEGLLIEKAAVQILDDEQVVFVPDGEGRFRPAEIETGEADSRFVKILSGLEEGAEYVTNGAFELKAKIVTSTLGGHAGHGH